MSRLDMPKADDLDEAQQALRDAVVGSRKGLGAEVWGRGPFGVWQSAPNVGHPALDLGAAVRFRTGLSPDVREVAICTVGVHYKAKFEFVLRTHWDRSGFRSRSSTVWRPEKIRVGLVTRIAHRYTATLLLIIAFRLSSMMRWWGPSRTQALSNDHGWLYCLICLALNAFEVPCQRK